MKLYEIYFSPTGGTKKVTKIISDVWKCEKEELDLLNPKIEGGQSFQSEDLCMIAVPSFGGRVPETALSKLKTMSGNGAKAILIVVYGNRDFDDTLLELKDSLKEAGFCCAAAITAVAEHSIMHQFATGRPDPEDVKELTGFAEQIKERFVKLDQMVQENQTEIAELPVSGNYPYKEYHGVPLKPKANKDCTKCGKCAEECPVQAIPRENPETVDKEKCISCMHCIAICPKQARQNNPVLLFGAVQKLKSSCSGRKVNKLYL